MKKIFILSSALVMALAVTSCSSKTETATTEKAVEKKVEMEALSFNLNTEASTLEWKGTMVGIYSHTGTLNITEGSVMTENGNIIGGKVVIDMSSMQATDENYDPSKDQTKENLIGHLQSPDFFDVANNPTASFVIKSVNGNILTGDFTLRGVTKEESITLADVKVSEKGFEATSSFKINRQDYGVIYKSSMADMVLSDDLEITIAIKS
jgi:polyisoprenoid-binding protein YceI|tara:strand:- start:990 stop:1616 length:627 start_codon:yes stop_codon:yes gene_type:complete